MAKTKSRVSYGPRKELYDALKDRPYGFEISYSQLEAIIGRDPQGAGRGDVLQVRRWLIADFGKYLECRREQGYFIAYAYENRDVGNRYRGRGRGNFAVALTIFAKTDVQELTHEQLQAHIEDQKRAAIEYLVLTKINKAKQIDSEPIAIPTGRELINIYKRVQP